MLFEERGYMKVLKVYNWSFEQFKTEFEFSLWNDVCSHNFLLKC